ncbi:hypothetical protein WJX74_007645 [Apatococcus lobatus]|uniref:DUF2470 domain-containing protein n=2 Tax=Apatococcus TaxID=904362 RepID=A0AAW1SQK1_9CHLO
MATEAGEKAASTVRDSSSDQELEQWLANQQSASRISPAAEARTLVSSARTATISTVTSDKTLAGFPNAGVIEFVADEAGRPVMILSSLSAHMRDLKADGRASITCLSPGFKGMDDSRVTLTGTVELLSGAEEKAARDMYRQRHPESFWIDFGDFEPFRMTSISKVRLNGGFARAATVSASDYAAAQPDPIASFAAPIAKHMNEDHAESTVAMLRHFGKLSAEAAQIVGLDSLGLDLLVTKDSQSFKGRLPFARPALTRKEVREVIVEMTRASA